MDCASGTIVSLSNSEVTEERTSLVLYEFASTNRDAVRSVREPTLSNAVPRVLKLKSSPLLVATVLVLSNKFAAPLVTRAPGTDAHGSGLVFCIDGNAVSAIMPPTETKVAVLNNIVIDMGRLDVQEGIMSETISLAIGFAAFVGELQGLVSMRAADTTLSAKLKVCTTEVVS